jgi:hypothetical protein
VSGIAEGALNRDVADDEQRGGEGGAETRQECMRSRVERRGKRRGRGGVSKGAFSMAGIRSLSCNCCRKKHSEVRVSEEGTISFQGGAKR